MGAAGGCTGGSWSLAFKSLACGLRFGIYDANPMLPSQRLPSLESESGRGLLLLDALADKWGIKPHSSGGKYVWFELFVVG